jgi:hypothetical protein
MNPRDSSLELLNFGPAFENKEIPGNTQPLYKQTRGDLSINIISGPTKENTRSVAMEKASCKGQGGLVVSHSEATTTWRRHCAREQRATNNEQRAQA